MDDLQPLLDARNLLARELDLHRLKGTSLQKKYEGAVLALQEACQHSDLDEQHTYHQGGYDYCASTTVNTYCKTCGFLVDTHEETHHGRFG